MKSEVSIGLMKELNECLSKVGKMDETYHRPMGILGGIYLGDNPAEMLADPVAGKYVEDLENRKWLKRVGDKIEVTTSGKLAFHLYFDSLKIYTGRL